MASFRCRLYQYTRLIWRLQNLWWTRHYDVSTIIDSSSQSMLSNPRSPRLFWLLSGNLTSQETFQTTLECRYLGRLLTSSSDLLRPYNGVWPRGGLDRSQYIIIHRCAAAHCANPGCCTLRTYPSYAYRVPRELKADVQSLEM